MPKTTDRFTKAKTLAEIREMRDQFQKWFGMTKEELKKEYDIAFSGLSETDPTREYMLRGLILNRTYYLTNVLNLE